MNALAPIPYEQSLKLRYAATRAKLWTAPPRPEPEKPKQPAPRERHYAPLDMLTPCSWRFIMDMIIAKHNVLRSDLLGRCRTDPVTKARQELMLLVYQHTAASTPQIGRYLRRDHTTVLYALRKGGATRKLVEVPNWCAAKYRPKTHASRTGDGVES